MDFDTNGPPPFLTARQGFADKKRPDCRGTSMDTTDLRAIWKCIASIADPDEQIDFWAAHSHFWGDPAVRYVAWLREGGPERWHQAATRWNWDNGMAPLRWIVSQPECQAATALEIFYNGEPDVIDRIDKEEAALLNQIRQRWAAGTFKTGLIDFIYSRSYPADKYLDGVPASMRVSLPGTVPSKVLKRREEFADGFPASLLPELNG